MDDQNGSPFRSLPARRARRASSHRRFGATARYLPAYSPDLNPIVMAFSKLKAALRQLFPSCCARPISPIACSKTTPRSSTLASSYGVAFSTSSVASTPSPAVIGLLPVNQSEVWYYFSCWRSALGKRLKLPRVPDVAIRFGEAGLLKDAAAPDAHEISNLNCRQTGQ